LIAWLFTVPAQVASVVSIAGASEVTVDGLSLRARLQRQVDANVLADFDATFECSSVWNPLVLSRTTYAPESKFTAT